MFKTNITISLVLIGLLATNFASASVVINEIAWMGTEVSPNDEWIELYNNSSTTVNLEGWVLKAADGSPEIHLAGSVLANDFYLLERTDDNTLPYITADQIYTGTLKNSGEELQLYDAENNLIDPVNCSAGWFAGDNASKQTMERTDPELSGSHLDSWATSQNPGGTPKAQNSAIAITEEPVIEEEPQPESQPEPQPVVYPSGIVITEILPSPLGPDVEEEWIEIFNENAQETDISLWQITDTVGTTKTYTFPEKTIIEAKGFLVLYRPVSEIILNNSGDTLNLSQPNGNILDSVTYEKAPRNHSYSKTIYGWKWSNVLTPGEINVVPSPKKELVGDVSPDTISPDTPSTSSPTIKELAAVGKQIPESSLKSLYIFLIALGLAIFSGAIILFLKSKLKTENAIR